MTRIVVSRTFMLILFFYWGMNTIFSQTKKQGTIEFDKTTHDFGVIEERQGKASYKFEFENTGNVPVVISRVRTSCGCTSPSWTKNPVLPGKIGYVQATFSARNRPGNFNKTVTVYSNASNSRITLRIKGKVTPKAKTVEQLYPNKLGDLWLNTLHASFARIRNTQEKTYVLKGYNASDKKMDVVLRKLPNYISAELPKKQIGPKEKFNISLKYNAGLMNNYWGFKSGDYPISVNGENVKDHKLKISATIIEDFSVLTPEQRANAPSFSINENIFDFKELKQGEQVTKEFMITNKGKSNLIIRKIDTGSDFITTKLRNSVIKPNKNTRLRIKFDSHNRNKGKQYRLINLICNDPKSSIIRIKVLGNIV